MKGKHIFSLFFSLFLLSFPFAPTAGANAGPPRWEALPSYGLGVQEDSPIRVEREDLTFDLSSGRFDWAPGGTVSAVYRMKNPGEAQNVQMAFPIAGDLPSIFNERVQVTLDGEPIDYLVYATNIASGGGYSSSYYLEDGSINQRVLPKFETIMKTVNLLPNEYQYLNQEQAEQITFDCHQPEGQLIEVMLKPSSTDVKILCEWAEKVLDEGTYWKIQFQSTSGLNPYLVILNGTVEITRVASVSYSSGSTTELSMDCIQRETKRLRPLLESIILSQSRYNGSSLPEIPDALYHLVVREMEKELADSSVISLGWDRTNIFSEERIFVLVYEVPFEAGQEREVGVQYSIKGTMDHSKNNTTVYTYGYLLNPAEHWASFKDLTLTVIPPVEYPYIVDTTIPMERQEDGTYTAWFPSLPEEDLSFTIYSKPEVTPIPGPFPWALVIQISLVALFAVFAIALFIRHIVLGKES